MGKKGQIKLQLKTNSNDKFKHSLYRISQVLVRSMFFRIRKLRSKDREKTFRTEQLQISLKRKTSKRFKTFYRRKIPLVENDTEHSFMTWDRISKRQFKCKINRAFMKIPTRTLIMTKFIALKALKTVHYQACPIKVAYDYAEDERLVTELQDRRLLPELDDLDPGYMPLKLDLQEYFQTGSIREYSKIPLVDSTLGKSTSSRDDGDVQIVAVKAPQRAKRLVQTSIIKYFKRTTSNTSSGEKVTQ